MIILYIFDAGVNLLLEDYLKDFSLRVFTLGPSCVHLSVVVPKLDMQLAFFMSKVELTEINILE